MQNHTELLQETKQHGSLLFPFNIYPCTIPGDFPSVSLHWHENMELICIKSGRGYVQYGTIQANAAADDIFVIPPGNLHAIYGRGQRMDYENIIFDLRLLGGGAADVCDQKYLSPLSSGALLMPLHLNPGSRGYKEISECVQQAENCCGKRERGFELLVKSSMLRLIGLLTEYYPEKPSVESPDAERLKKVTQIVEKEYNSKLTIEDIAARCAVSSSHFMRWFHQMTGTSFNVYLNERRLAYAADLLRQSDDKIVDIAGRTGFDNLSNFNRRFKKRYGITPREYRHQNVVS
ncbi:MAG: AraC family transcriptional regulator [Lachnospiraceae bacterium]|jgi:AraC-like DNA-binding protein|nr:AraC family transcriptional regulator [Lachnospiraceae bacterium]